MSLDTMDKIYREGRDWGLAAGFAFGAVAGVIVLIAVLYFSGAQLVLP